MSKLDDISRRYFNRIAMQLVEQGIPWIERPSEKGAKETIISEIEENSASDIEYLLSRLVIAEKALERYANLHKMMYDDAVQGELYEHWWIRQSEHAIRALKQIRE